MRKVNFAIVLLLIMFSQNSQAQVSINGYWINNKTKWHTSDNKKYETFTTIIKFEKNGVVRVVTGWLYKSSENYTLDFLRGYALALGKWESAHMMITINADFIENTSPMVKVKLYTPFKLSVIANGDLLFIQDEIYKKLDLSNKTLVDVGKVFSDATEEDKITINKMKAQQQKKSEELKRYLSGE